MANYKRGYCRYRRVRARRGSQASWRAKYGLKPVVINYKDYEPRSKRHKWRSLWPNHVSMMRQWPAWHDILFHSRPHRRATQRLAWEIVRGADPDDIAWPLRRKPHKYYW